MTLEANEWFQLVIAHEHVGGPKLNGVVAVTERITLTEGRYETSAELAAHIISLWNAELEKLIKAPHNTALQNDMLDIQFNPRTNKMKFILKDRRYAIKFSSRLADILAVPEDAEHPGRRHACRRYKTAAAEIYSDIGPIRGVIQRSFWDSNLYRA